MSAARGHPIARVLYDVYRIRTQVTEPAKVRCWEQLDEDFAYDPNQLDGDACNRRWHKWWRIRVGPREPA